MKKKNKSKPWLKTATAIIKKNLGHIVELDLENISDYTRIC